MNGMNNTNNPGNVFLAVTLSLSVLLGFHFFYERPRLEAERRAAAVAAMEQKTIQAAKPVEQAPLMPKDRAALVAETTRLKISSPSLSGSLNLTGARLDDLTLQNYRETLAADSPAITLLSPAGALPPHPGYYAEFGWLADTAGLAPDASSQWQSNNTALTPQTPVTLRWDNGKGQIFERTIAIDDHYMFNITDRVTNNGTQPVTLHPFGLVMHHGKPNAQEMAFGHIGPMGVFDGVLQEHSYDSLEETPEVTEAATGGWLGITDKYWLTALIPNSNEKIAATFRFARTEASKFDTGRYQVDFRGEPLTITPSTTVEYKRHFFAGAKRLELLRDYGDKLEIEKFDLAIDFGWFRILTKPMLITLTWLGEKTGNVGIAILLLTIIVKLLVLPLGVKSYRSMAKMKLLQPDMQRLQERYKDDRQRLSIEMMELYKREKISPVSGCLPIFAQLPIFFALYKVLYIGIDMRHAPFFGWIKDLSAPDPTSLFNLFGVLPWQVPTLLHIGAWPLLMGLSMFLLQKMSPQPTDPIQKSVLTWMPVVFTAMLAPTMAAGLIIYWTWSNLLSMAQQYLIFRNITKH